jgi:hypothetical protein
MPPQVEGVRFGDRGGQEGHSPLAESPLSPMPTQEFTQHVEKQQLVCLQAAGALTTTSKYRDR